jgi:hypothetical protein
MKTANEARSGIFAEPAMLLRGANYQAPQPATAEKAALVDPKFAKAGEQVPVGLTKSSKP